MLPSVWSPIKKAVWSQLKEVNCCSLAPWDGYKLVGVKGSPLSECAISTLQLDIAGTTFVKCLILSLLI